MIKSNHGYTVVELMIAIAVSSLVITVLSSMTLTMYRQILISRTTSELNSESQILLHSIVEDTRLAGGLSTTNTITDNNAPSGGWVTNDPSNVLIINTPSTDSSANVLYDAASGLPYKNELIYFSSGKYLYKRVLKNESAIGNTAVTTCPASNSNCRADRIFTENLKDLTFTFYDENDQSTSDATSARSVSLSVVLEKQTSGKYINVSNSMRTTLRNR